MGMSTCLRFASLINIVVSSLFVLKVYSSGANEPDPNNLDD